MAIFTLLINSSGFVLIFTSYRKHIKDVMSQQIKSGKYQVPVEVIKIPDKDYLRSQLGFRMLDSREFVLKGKMYDIIKSVRLNDTTIFWCLNDEQEEKVIRQFNDMINSNIDGFAKGIRTLYAKLMKLIITSAELYLIQDEVLLPDKAPLRIFNYIKPYSIVPDIQTPPPRITC